MNTWPLALSLLAVLLLFSLILLYSTMMQRNFLKQLDKMQAASQEQMRLALNLISSKDPMTFLQLQAAQPGQSLTTDYIPTDDESEAVRYDGLTEGLDLGYDDSDAEREALSELADLGFDISDQRR
jgi:hypothetical protein